MCVCVCITSTLAFRRPQSNLRIHSLINNECACDDDPSLPDTLNHFYSRFEMQNDTPAQKLPTPPNDQALCLSAADVRKTLSRINPRKAAGPDSIKTVLLSWRMS